MRRRVLALATGLAVFSALPAAAGETVATDAEVVFWRTVVDRDDPAEYRAYLKLYPDGIFAELARIRLAQEGPDRSPDAGAAPAVAGDLYFATKVANVRARPTTKAEKIARLAAGAPVRVMARVDGADWYEVRLADGRRGFVYARLLSADPKFAGVDALDALGDIGDASAF